MEKEIAVTSNAQLMDIHVLLLSSFTCVLQTKGKIGNENLAPLREILFI